MLNSRLEDLKAAEPQFLSSDARSYVPPVKIGAVMRAGGVGRVVLAPKGSKLQVGQWVNGTLGWTEYAIAKVKDLEKIS